MTDKPVAPVHVVFHYPPDNWGKPTPPHHVQFSPSGRVHTWGLGKDTFVALTWQWRANKLTDPNERVPASALLALQDEQSQTEFAANHAKWFANFMEHGSGYVYAFLPCIERIEFTTPKEGLD